MSKQSFTTGQVLTAAQVNSLQANDYNQTVSVKTASYVLVAADKGTRIEFNTSGSVTCTVNSGLFDAGDTLVIQNRGAGTATVTAGTATVNTSASLAISQYGQGILYFVDNTSAIFFAGAPGDITGVTTGATSGLTGGVTSGTADLKLNFASKGQLAVGTGSGTTDFLNVGTNGYTLVADSSVSPTGLKWAAPAGGSGLTLVSSTSLSASTININSVFSSTYENYLLVLNVTNMSLGANIRFRLRASGTDTTTNYGMQLVQTYQSTLNGQESTVTDYWQFGNADPTQCFMVVELARPNVAANTFAISHSITGLSGTFNDLLSEWYGAVQKSSTQFDGITIYSHNSATITGNMRIYGRADS